MAYRALQQPRIGWIGAGRMGLHMAARLLGFSTVSMDASVTVREAGRKRDTDGLEAL